VAGTCSGTCPSEEEASDAACGKITKTGKRSCRYVANFTVFYVTREEAMSRKHLEEFSTETSLYLNISILSHVALSGLFEVDIDILEKVPVFINRIHDL